jgi:dienelactone hydrolase
MRWLVVTPVTLSSQSPALPATGGVAPSFELAPPTGRAVVGITRLAVTTGPRPLVVTVWYPASAPGAARRLAPYLGEAAALREVAGWGRNSAPLFLRHAGVITHAHRDAAPARGRFPVILFSHGYLDLPSNYTALMEELASHGYAVFSVAHTGETMAVTLPDGQVSSVFKREGGLDATPARVLGEWNDEDSVSARVTAARTSAEAESILRGYLARIPNSAEVVERWGTNLIAVVDALQRLNARQSGSPFAQRLDLTRLAAVGHSMGGVASVAFCARDARCRATINLDGTPQYGALIDHPAAVPVLMVYGARAGRIGVSDVVYDKGAEYWRAVVEGTLHLNVGDWVFWPAGSPIASSLGPLGAEASTSVVRRLVREFLERTLRRGRAPLFDGGATVPGLTIVRRRP